MRFIKFIQLCADDKGKAINKRPDREYELMCRTEHDLFSDSRGNKSGHISMVQEHDSNKRSHEFNIYDQFGKQ